MSIASSEKRCTSEGTLSCASTPKDAQQGFSKAGRRVLAELACNDSPVIGLLPPGTPASSSSCKPKSGSGGVPVRSRRALLSNPPSHPASTPLGESLLRSQVQLLLQRVESDISAPPCPRVSVHPSLCSGFMVSPTMLAAPTPLNTPATMAPMTMQHPQTIYGVNVQNVCTDKTLVPNGSMDGSCVQSVSMHGHSQDPVGILQGHASSAEQPSVRNGLDVREPPQQDVLSVSSSFNSFVSATTCLDKKPLEPILVLSEVSDVPSPSEIFSGKRVLHFDDDTPCKDSPTKQFHTKIFEQAGHHSLVRELDDDELSEWSVHVNVGSPSDKQSCVEQAEHMVPVEIGDLEEANDEVCSSLHEHVKKQENSSSKVDLLWHKGRERKASVSRSEDEHYEGGGEEEDADYPEQFYSGNEEEMGIEEDEGGCDNLCDMFRGMRFGEEVSKGLPRAEGKHIRFLYGEDDSEIVEAMVVTGEKEGAQGCTAMRLNGLPVPLGRHWRFDQDDEEEEE